MRGKADDRVMMIVLVVLLLSNALADAKPVDPGRDLRLEAIAKERAEEDRRNAADPCLRRDGNDWTILRWRDCLKLGPAKRMQGVWYYGFEESGFVPDVRTVSLKRRQHVHWPELDTVLDVDLAQVMKARRIKLGLPCTTAIAIDFIGRDAVMPFGGVAQPTAKRIIAVDRVVDARLVGIVRTDGRPRRCPKRVN